MYELIAPDFIKLVASHISLTVSQVRSAIQLFDEGNTIPFIARYRKEMTGELDENELREIQTKYESEKSLFGRKCDVVRLLGELDVLKDDDASRRLVAAIEKAQTMTEVDDLYRPYRPKRKTRASRAMERGLGPLMEWLISDDARSKTEDDVRNIALEFVNDEKGVTSIDDAMDGAADIFAEEVADDADTRKRVRRTVFERGMIRSTAVDADADSVYEAYYKYEEPLAKTLPHRILAMNRGEREGFLKIAIVAPDEEILSDLIFLHLHRRRDIPKGSFIASFLGDAIKDGYKRLISPAIEREIRSELTETAEDQAIVVFGENLKNLLMQPPIRSKVVLGVDPAYRTGCKLAVVDDTGKMLLVTVIYPTPPQSKVEEAKSVVLRLLKSYGISLIAIGNGTASRETEAFIAECVREHKEVHGLSVPYVIVSEAGASVYSASPLAGEEFPSLDVSERSAISIARRIQDPLAELVKIDPKSVGVGQYQHDVSEKKLDEQLGAVVETAVNQVGVDVNTASPSLLSYVAGLNKTVARNIVEYRETNGRFTTRKMLGKVPRLGKKTLEQCVGFLRIPGGQEVLDATPIHPESYDVVTKLLQRDGRDSKVLSNPTERKTWIQDIRRVPLEELSLQIGVGGPTLNDILDALERPGRDPREDVPAPILRTDVLKLADLEVGMILTGTVRNVVDFGAFVDVGIKNDGLVHISQLADRFVKHPMDVVSVGDIVTVKVIQIDAAKERLGLSMKGFAR